MIFLALSIILLLIAILIYLSIPHMAFKREWEYVFYGIVCIGSILVTGLFSILSFLIWVGYKMGAKI